METIIQIAAEITGCIDTAAEVCQIVTTDMAEAVPVLSFRVHLPLELSCGTASVGTSTPAQSQLVLLNNLLLNVF